MRHSVSWRDQLLERYPILRNFVDDRNTVSIRWLRWLGFKLHDPVVIGGHVFRIFELRSSDVRYHDGPDGWVDAVGRGRGGAARAGVGGGQSVQRANHGHERPACGSPGEGCD
ncbi:hypothetical protein [Bradyrhizobium cenepequi]